MTTYNSYPPCGWIQEIPGQGNRCLMVGMVTVQLPDGGRATLCTTHAERFERGARAKANKATYQISANQIEAE